MQTNYNIWYIRREDDVHIDESAVWFFEGNVNTKNEFDDTAKKVIPVTKYRKLKILQMKDLPQFSDKQFVKDSDGNDAVLFTSKDFGDVSTEEELRLFLNIELAKDKTRTPIPEQQ